VADESRPPDESLRAGYEVRDLHIALVVGSAAVLVLLGVSLHALLWEVCREAVPEQRGAGASPPTLMPGEPAVNDRVRSIPPPRLDPLEPLEVTPPMYTSSRPVPRFASSTQRPEDLRADRQPQLSGYGWVEPGKVARIPVNKAMDAVVEAERAKRPAKKGGGK
jgi:hypothetical protein